MTHYQIRTILSPMSHIGGMMMTIGGADGDGVSIVANQNRYKTFVSAVESGLRKATRHG